jgi:hypothetical protein
MWQKPGGRALRFTAVEELAVREVAFSWRARFRMAPLLSLRVHDWYRDGEGGLEARLLGLPVMSSRGVDVAQGEAMRYLAELPWVPHAFVANLQVSWRELDATSVEVATRVGEATVAVRLEFDGAGDIVGAFADARPRREGKTNVPTPWSGVYSEYDVVGGSGLRPWGRSAGSFPRGRSRTGAGRSRGSSPSAEERPAPVCRVSPRAARRRAHGGRVRHDSRARASA